MASLSDYLQPGGNAAAANANYSLESGLASIDAGEQLRRLERNYTSRQLPSLVNMHAARGTFMSGGIGREADMLKQDVGDTTTDINMDLAKTLAGLRRQGILAASGISI